MDILVCINLLLKVVRITLNNVHYCVPTNVIFFLRGNRMIINHMFMYNRVSCDQMNLIVIGHNLYINEYKGLSFV